MKKGKKLCSGIISFFLFLTVITGIACSEENQALKQFSIYIVGEVSEGARFVVHLEDKDKNPLSGMPLQYGSQKTATSLSGEAYFYGELGENSIILELSKGNYKAFSINKIPKYPEPKQPEPPEPKEPRANALLIAAFLMVIAIGLIFAYLLKKNYL